MIRWAVFISASLVLHMIIFIIPFPVSFRENLEPSRIVVDVELIRPAKEEIQPTDTVTKATAVSRTKKSPPQPATAPPENAPSQTATAMSSPFLHSTAAVSDRQKTLEGASRSEPRVATTADTSRRVHPVYPLVSRRRGEEGEVRLLVTLGPSGSLVEVMVYSSSGYTALDESAAAAVRKWFFAPGAPEKLIVPVIFKLDQ